MKPRASLVPAWVALAAVCYAWLTWPSAVGRVLLALLVVGLFALAGAAVLRALGVVPSGAKRRRR